jgi:hypothetical protein
MLGLLGGDEESAKAFRRCIGKTIVHEVAFLEVTTDRGVFQMKNHNEHNGYYGGFLIRCLAD